jgi:hypothetical protein
VEEKAPKKKAGDNPWYLLASLYGEPHVVTKELRYKNRVAWNRYIATALDEDTRTRLIQENGHLAEELTPLSDDELQSIEVAFAERSKSSQNCSPDLPVPGSIIDFSNIEFDHDVNFYGYHFRECSFEDTTFNGWAEFSGSAFFGRAIFSGAAFQRRTTFINACLSG